jgi:hypothetical protein
MATSFTPQNIMSTNSASSIASRTVSFVEISCYFSWMLHLWKKVLRELTGPKREEVNAGGEHCMAGSFTVWVLDEIVLA